MRLFSWRKIISNFSIFVKIIYSKSGVESNTFYFQKSNCCFTPPERNRACNFVTVVDFDMKSVSCPGKLCCVSKFIPCPAKLRWSLYGTLTPQRLFPSSRPTTMSNANDVGWLWSIHKSIFYLIQKCGALPIYL